MNFGQALEAMKAGKRVSHSGWNPGEWIAVEGGDIIAHTDHSQPCLWRPGQACLLSDGWLVLQGGTNTTQETGVATMLAEISRKLDAIMNHTVHEAPQNSGPYRMSEPEPL